MFQFAQQRDLFQPAETLLDPFPLLLTQGIAGVPRGAGIDGAAAPSAVVLRHMRRNVHNLLLAPRHQVEPTLRHEIGSRLTTVDNLS